MTGKTHRVGGMLAVLGGYTVLSTRGLLLENVSPFVQLAVMYPFALYGSTFSDLDHGEQSIPSRDVFSVGVNKLLHIGKYVGGLDLLIAKHRSWQTHSDLFLLVTGVFFMWMANGYGVGIENLIMLMIGIGFSLGVLSHLVLDLLTPEGIWSILLTGINYIRKKKEKVKLSLVPNTEFFSTGGKWESLVRSIMWFFVILLFLYVAYTALPYEIVFER